MAQEAGLQGAGTRFLVTRWPGHQSRVTGHAVSSSAGGRGGVGEEGADGAVVGRLERVVQVR